MSKSLEEYFKGFLASGIIDFSIRVSEPEEGKMQFYIHPENQPGETSDYEVEGNELSCVNKGEVNYSRGPYVC